MTTSFASPGNLDDTVDMVLPKLQATAGVAGVAVADLGHLAQIDANTLVFRMKDGMSRDGYDQLALERVSNLIKAVNEHIDGGCKLILDARTSTDNTSILSLCSTLSKMCAAADQKLLVFPPKFTNAKLERWTNSSLILISDTEDATVRFVDISEHRSGLIEEAEAALDAQQKPKQKPAKTSTVALEEFSASTVEEDVIRVTIHNKNLLLISESDMYKWSEELKTTIAHSNKDIVLDLTAVDEISTVHLGYIVARHKQAIAAGSNFEVLVTNNSGTHGSITNLRFDRFLNIQLQ